VSRNIIRQHGGDIRVRSILGEGSTFTVVLPVAQVPADLSAGVQ
jgi:signal transduction histidine kinase